MPPGAGHKAPGARDQNPLAPIQLSAERLQHRRPTSWETTDAAMLARATTTIVNQVAALKKMVDAFKDYARSPKQRAASAQSERSVALHAAARSNPPGKHRSRRAPLPVPAPPCCGGWCTICCRTHWTRWGDSRQKVLLLTLLPGQGAAGSAGQRPGFCRQICASACSSRMSPPRPKGTGLGLAIVKKSSKNITAQSSSATSSRTGAGQRRSAPLSATVSASV